MEPQELKKKLIDQIEQVCTHLYPNGKKQNGNWLIGDIYGSDGKSFGICLKDNQYKGLGKEFNSTDRGVDIISMWMAVKSMSFKESLSDIHQYLGLVEEIERPIALKKPTPFTKDQLAPANKCQIEKHLQDRGITPETQAKYKVVRCKRNPSKDNDVFIGYQHESPEGEKLLLKYKGLRRKPDGKQDTGVHKVRSDDPSWSTLFGWWLVDDNTREINITEGQEDCMALSQVVGNDNVPTLSLPMGTNNLNWIDCDWNRLQQFERINLFFDNDYKEEKNHGQICAREVSKRLGVNRVYNIVTKYNDANEMLLNAEPEELEWHEIHKISKRFGIDEIIGHNDEFDDIVRVMDDKINPKKNYFIHPELPFCFRDGETTIISGHPNSGKSAWLYHAHICEMMHGRKVLICSMEITPARMKYQLSKIVIAKVPSCRGDLELAAKWLDGKVWYYRKPKKDRKTGCIDFAKFFSNCEYAVKRFGINMIVIDSIHHVAPKKGYEEQDLFIDTLYAFNQDNDVHGSIVCHQRKGSRLEVGGMEEVGGSGGISIAPDNGLTIFRNIVKEKPFEYDEGDNTPRRIKKLLEGPDGILSVWKKRDGGELPSVGLLFNKQSETFRTENQEEWRPLVFHEDDF